MKEKDRLIIVIQRSRIRVWGLVMHEDEGDIYSRRYRDMHSYIHNLRNRDM
jgi:hypothetical protein